VKGCLHWRHRALKLIALRALVNRSTGASASIEQFPGLHVHALFVLLSRRHNLVLRAVKVRMEIVDDYMETTRAEDCTQLQGGDSAQYRATGRPSTSVCGADAVATWRHARQVRRLRASHFRLTRLLSSCSTLLQNFISGLAYPCRCMPRFSFSKETYSCKETEIFANLPCPSSCLLIPALVCTWARTLHTQSLMSLAKTAKCSRTAQNSFPPQMQLGVLPIARLRHMLASC
jgi:hypothetical protein